MEPSHIAGVNAELNNPFKNAGNFLIKNKPSLRTQQFHF